MLQLGIQVGTPQLTQLLWRLYLWHQTPFSTSINEHHPAKGSTHVPWASNMQESRLHKLMWTDMKLVQGFIRVTEPSNSLKTSVYSTSNKKQQNLKLKKALDVKPGSITRRLVGRWAHFFSPDRFKYSKNHIGSRKSWSVRSWRKNSFISAKRSSLISFSLLTIGLGKRNETGWSRKKILIGLFQECKIFAKSFTGQVFLFTSKWSSATQRRDWISTTGWLFRNKTLS